MYKFIITYISVYCTPRLIWIGQTILSDDKLWQHPAHDEPVSILYEASSISSTIIISNRVFLFSPPERSHFRFRIAPPRMINDIWGPLLLVHGTNGLGNQQAVVLEQP